MCFGVTRPTLKKGADPTFFFFFCYRYLFFDSDSDRYRKKPGKCFGCTYCAFECSIFPQNKLSLGSVFECIHVNVWLYVIAPAWIVVCVQVTNAHKKIKINK